MATVRTIQESLTGDILGLAGASGFNAQNLAALQQLAAVNNASSSCPTGLSGLNSATGN